MTTRRVAVKGPSTRSARLGDNQPREESVNYRNLLAAAMLIGSLGGPVAAADGKVIAGIVFQQDQFFRAFQLGMEAAAAKAGAELLQANSESKPDKEQSLISTYISRGVGAIIISPIGEAASAPALGRAAK